MNKTIGLAGFYDEQILYLRKKIKNANFIDINKNNSNAILNSLNALICITESELDKLFLEDQPSNYKNLDWVHASSAGIDNYRHVLSNINFTFTCGRIIQGPNVADHAMALLLSLTRRLPWCIKGVDKFKMPRPTELKNKKVLIIGLGGIGTLIAERCNAFGMVVSSIDKFMKPLYSFIENQYLPKDLDYALSHSDVIIVSSPLTNSTDEMLGYKELNRMQDDAYLINISRGKIIDLLALDKILNKGKLSGVGLDVTYPEVLKSNHPLFKYERVIITPHIAGMSTDNKRRFNLIERNIENYLSNSTLLNIVDKEEGF
tara:strand:+ start:161 stop:1111 length:951 start_codon:yes stop_codon:yes gene_type:complete